MRPILLLVVPLGLLAAAPAAAQQDAIPAAAPELRALRAAPLTSVIRLDGRLDEEAWAAAEVATDFTESWPDPGAAASERTEARVLYDENALYVGLRLYDSAPDSIAAQLARRDASGIYSDWAHVMVDSYHDRRSAFRFTVNPRGVKKDVFHFDDTNEDLSWDAVWEVATSVDSLGWTAEYRIPYSQLRFGSESGDRVWGVQFQRDIARREERSSWSPWNRNDPGFVSRFGDLAGLSGVRTPKRIELVPYTSARLTRAPGDANDPFYRSTEPAASVGADLKMGLPSGLTLTATVNPDFGQVELDPAEVNLSAFESFFSEKRPFFLEGADIFRFGHPRSFNNWGYSQPFYSRRIGRHPQRRLGGAEHPWVDGPEQTTIAAAAKLSGKTPGGWSIGVLDAVTPREHARFVGPDGREGEAVVEPLTNYFVGRVRRDLRQGQTVVGAMTTATHRGLDDPFVPLLRSSAYLGGVDFDHSWSNRAWNVNGYVAGSRIHGDRSVITAAQRSSARYFQRPDADHLDLDTTRTSLSGYAGAVALQKVGGEHWLGSLTLQGVSPGFEVNDLGFQTRADYVSFSTLLMYRENQPTRHLRNYAVFGFTNHAWNFGGDPHSHGAAVAGDAQLKNYWSVSGRTGFSPTYRNDRLTRGGPISAVPEQWNVSLGISSDARKPLVGRVNSNYREDASGEYDISLRTSLEMRPSANLRVALGPAVVWERDTDQFVTQVSDPLAESTFGQRYVFADVDQTTVYMDTRVEWTFTPELSLQLFAQPFVAAGDFSGYKEFLRPGAYDFAVYGKDRGTISRGASCSEPAAEGSSYVVDPDGAGAGSCFSFGERDFNFRSLRGNAVLRWEYRPGSALFFVWQQQRALQEPLGTFDFSRDYGALFREPSANVFLIKATYWIGR